MSTAHGDVVTLDIAVRPNDLPFRYSRKGVVLGHNTPANPIE